MSVKKKEAELECRIFKKNILYSIPANNTVNIQTYICIFMYIYICVCVGIYTDIYNMSRRLSSSSCLADQ